MPVTTNYKTDLGNVFVSYSDVENLITQNSPIATLLLTNTSISEESSINFYIPQKRTNTYNIPVNTLATLIVYTGYYVNLSTSTTTTVDGTATTVTTSNTTYYPGNYSLIDNNSNVSGTTITGSITINSIVVYNPVGQYWSLYPAASGISATSGIVTYISEQKYYITNTSTTPQTISTSTFTNILGNNFNNQNIVLANASIVPYEFPVYDSTATTSLYTNFFISYSNNLSNLIFSQLILLIPSFNTEANGNDYYTILYDSSPVSISNDNSTLFYALNVIYGEYSNTTFSYTYTTQVIPYVFSINSSSSTPSYTLLYGGIASAITLGTFTAGSKVTDYANLCQVQILNGQPFCMIGGNTGAWVNNGTSGSSFQFTQVTTTDINPFVDINSLSMSETGQYQLIGSAYIALFSNNFGASFTAIYSESENKYSNLQISSQSQYAVASTIAGDSYDYIPYLSSDYGETWSEISSYLSTATEQYSISSISISSNGQSIIINNQGSSFYSNDYGATFTKTISTTTANNVSSIFPSEQPIAIALGSITSTTNGIYISQ